MLDLVYYLHWFLMGLVGLAGISLLVRPHVIARVYMIAFLGQQLILNGCIMTTWENHVKVDMGFEPRTNEFIMTHILTGVWVPTFKLLFAIVIVLQILEIKAQRRPVR